MPQRRGAMPISDTDVICAPDTYARGVPHDSLARLRAKTPVVWMNERQTGGPGCWAVLRWADARYVLERPELFTVRPDRGRLHDATAPTHDLSMIDMDPRPHELLDRVALAGEGDFTGDATGDLPESVRNALAGGVYALLRHPEQYARLRGDPGLLDRAVEEILRWWTPMTHVRRTVRRRTVVGGIPLRPGEQITVWLCSADHDDEVFTDPGRFDVGRTPNAHLAFGHGPRPCLGARLTRAHLRALIVAMLDRPGRLELAGEPIRLRSTAHNGFKRLPVRWRR